MSPLEGGRVIRDKDSFWRDERGLLSMPHLTASIASFSGVLFCLFGVYAFFFTNHVDSLNIIQIGAGLIGASAGLEGWQTHIESKNQSNSKK